MHSPVLLATACAGALATAAVADEPTPADAAPTLHWEGSVDADYAYNFNHPADHANFIPGIGTTAKRANEFSLNLASLGISIDPAPVGFHLLLGYGTATDVEHSGEPVGVNTGPDIWRYLQTASVTFSKGRVGAEAGIYPSHIGFESLQSQGNWNYTRGWVSEFSPFYQAGLKLSYQFSDAWSAQVHLINGWQVIGDNNHAKSVGTQVAYNRGLLSVTFNTSMGPEIPGDDTDWRFFGDLIVQLKPTGRLSLALVTDGALQQHPGPGDAHWYGVAGNARYQLTEKLALAGRGEVFRDLDGAISGTAQTLTGGTGTVELRPVQHLILKLEGRYDHSTANVFSGKRDPVTGAPRLESDEALLMLGAVATL